MIRSFFAVTETSVYWVRDRISKKDPSLIKIMVRGESELKVGHTLSGSMIAICDRLIPYIPEGGGITSFQRKIEKVNMRYWLGNTSKIIALFKKRDSAIKCFREKDLQPCDPRWYKETKYILDKIDENHPSFEICKHPGLSLFPSETKRNSSKNSSPTIQP